MEKQITKSDIKKVVGKYFDSSSVLGVKKYTHGNINKMFEIKLKGAKKPILLRLFNEAWKAKKEEFVYRDLKAHIDIPLPELFCVDDTKKIIPYAFSLMSKIEGQSIDKSYKKYGNKNLFKKAGEILAKIHMVDFNKFGWIVENQINPAFDSWRDFVWHDIELKLSNLKNIPKIMSLIGDIEHYMNSQGYLLDIRKGPCLLHKDYHCPHILTDKNNITGIIDVEWAIAGHNENDFIKMELWAFNKIKGVRDSFFKGYLKYGHISSDYTDRKKIYELWHWINMTNISLEIKNKEWLRYNTKTLEKFLKK